MESVISFIMYESYYWLYLELWINFVSASIKGQPLYKGQKVRSQCVRYSEVPLYLLFPPRNTTKGTQTMHKMSYH